MFLRDTRARCSVYDGATMYRLDWTDGCLQERFDSIDRRFDEVDWRFDQVDRRIDQVDRRIDDLDRRVDKRFDKVDGKLKGLDAKFDAKFDGLQRTLMVTGGGIIATLIAGIVTVFATQL